jgi:hypothetical protein
VLAVFVPPKETTVRAAVTVSRRPAAGVLGSRRPVIRIGVSSPGSVPNTAYSPHPADRFMIDVPDAVRRTLSCQ